MIQDGISLWKDELENVIDNNKKACSGEESYYLLSYDGLNKIISMNTYENLE